jgi:hypothetical protein
MRITLSDAHAMLVGIVNDFGANHSVSADDNPNGCFYAEMVKGRIQASCIVGQFLDRLGLLGVVFNLRDSASLADALEGQEGICTPDSVIWGRLEENGVTVEEDAQRFLRFAQNWQDKVCVRDAHDNYVSSDGRWGAAVDFAVAQIAEETEMRLQNKLAELRADSQALALAEHHTPLAV